MTSHELRTISGELKTIDGKSSTGTFEIRHLSPGERTRESLKWLGIFWAVAVVCVLVPMLHFVLVPAFLIIGPIVAFRVYKIHERIATGNAACPVCGKPVTFSDVRFRPTFKEICPSCANQLYVHF